MSTLGDNFGPQGMPKNIDHWPPREGQEVTKVAPLKINPGLSKVGFGMPKGVGKMEAKSNIPGQVFSRSDPGIFLGYSLGGLI